LTGELDQDDIERIWTMLENEPGTEVTVDLQAREVRCVDIVAPMQVDDYTRWRLIEGLDDIALTLRHVDEIAAYESRRSLHLPRTAV
jgi:3-isopropylmalate/(R)-2-methylmalate dehydratase small subunit